MQNDFVTLVRTPELSAVMTRRLFVPAMAITATLVASLSARVAVWWGRIGSGRTASPGPIAWLLEHRPDTGEADVHVAMWFTVAVCAWWALRSVRHPAVVLAGVWLLGASIEVAQATFTTRAAEWSDLAGNTLGIAGAAVLCAVVARRAPAPTRRVV